MNCSRGCKSEILLGNAVTVCSSDNVREPGPSMERDGLESEERDERNEGEEGEEGGGQWLLLNGDSQWDFDGMNDGQCQEISPGFKIRVGYVDTEDSDGSNLTVAENTETQGTMSFFNLARMNVNSNGKSTSDGVMEVVEQSEVMDSKASLRKVKHINMGEVPLKPVGLSLSGSGMQLFVKVDSEEQRKMLANANVKYTTRLRKPRAKKGATKPNVNSTTTQTANLPTPLARTRPGLKSAEKNDGVSDSDMGTPPMSMPPPRERNDNACTPGAENKRCYGDVMQNTVFSTELMPPPTKGRHRTEKDRMNTTPVHCSSRKANTETCDPILIQVPAVDHIAYEKDYARGAQPVMSGPSWKLENGAIDVTYHDNRDKARGDNLDERMGSETMMGSNPIPVGFTSSDLPLKPLRNAPKECSEPHYDNLARPGPYRKRKRFTLSSMHVDNSGGYSRVNVRDSSTDDEDDPYHDLVCSKDKSMARMSSIDDRNKSQHAKFAYPSTSDARAKPDTSEPPCLSRTFDKATSSTTIFEASQVSHAPLDATAIAKFTEYTTTMRMDLKRSFKDLNKLIKDFNEEVLERNNNRASNSSSGENERAKDEDQQIKPSGTQCTVM